MFYLAPCSICVIMFHSFERPSIQYLPPLILGRVTGGVEPMSADIWAKSRGYTFERFTSSSQGWHSFECVEPNCHLRLDLFSLSIQENTTVQVPLLHQTKKSFIALLMHRKTHSFKRDKQNGTHKKQSWFVFPLWPTHQLGENESLIPWVRGEYILAPRHKGTANTCHYENN